MNWIIIYMLCNRFCVPQYAEVVPTKQECITKSAATTNSYCIPLVK